MLRKLGFILAWPGLFLYFLGSKRTRVIIRCGEEILLVRDSGRYFFDADSWTIPGGGIQRGEEASVAAVREIHEELGIKLEPEELKQIAQMVSGGNGLRYTALFFEVKLARKPTIEALSNELSEAQWFPRSEAQQLPLKREAHQALQLLVSDK
jgi:8-oxo-dGTP diphosphatase